MIKSLFFLILLGMTVKAQVGINTSNPQGVFHIDGAKDNLTSSNLTRSQQSNDVNVTANGNLGIGIINPTNKIHAKGSNPIRLEGLVTGNINDSIIVSSASDYGVLKKIGSLNSLSVPGPAIFRLETIQTNFLGNAASGISQSIPMSLIKNSIVGLTYSGSTITIPPGTYQISLVYEALHNAPNCTISSYFVDFPLLNSSTRIHSTASHSEASLSNHGGTINYVTNITSTRTWSINLGRGQSGNCYGAGMNLSANSTQLLIFRIGD